MRLVWQETETTCGQSCVAMVADVTWSEAVAVVGKLGKTTSKNLRKALAALGIETGELVRLRRGDKVPKAQLAIVMLRRKGVSMGHWVVHQDGWYLDPAVGLMNPESDYPPETRATSFIPVRGKEEAA